MLHDVKKNFKSLDKKFEKWMKYTRLYMLLYVM